MPYQGSLSIILRLPALEDDCVATYRSFGTAQSTATCRPMKEKNMIPNMYIKIK